MGRIQEIKKYQNIVYNYKTYKYDENEISLTIFGVNSYVISCVDCTINIDSFLLRFLIIPKPFIPPPITTVGT